MTEMAAAAGPAVASGPAHPRLQQLVERAGAIAGDSPIALGLVHPCDALALEAASRIAEAGFARPVLIGEPEAIRRAAFEAQCELAHFEIVASPPGGAAAAERAAALVRAGGVAALMKGSLHTDELMSAVVARGSGLRGDRRISHAFLFDLPRYPKLLALADCVVNIAPDLRTKRDILANALDLLRALGTAQPKVAIVAAVETVNPSIPATVDAQALVTQSLTGQFGDAIVEGPFGFDNAYSAEAARIKKMHSRVAGDADLVLVPDLNAGNMLYKSFVYAAGADCAGLVLGALVPIVLTSRADSSQARLASAALAVMSASAGRHA